MVLVFIKQNSKETGKPVICSRIIPFNVPTMCTSSRIPAGFMFVKYVQPFPAVRAFDSRWQVFGT